MTTEPTQWEAEWEKFKDEYEPTDDLVKKAEQDEKRYKMSMNLLGSVSHGLDKQVVAIQARTAELHEVQKQIRHSEDQVRATQKTTQQMVAELREVIGDTEEWWDEKMDEMRKLMMLMVSMGFEFNPEAGLDDES